MIIKNVDSSINVISELPQSCTSINEVINSAANRNFTRRNSKIKTIFIDNIKDKIQRRRSSISIPMMRSEKRKSDLRDEDERLKSDEYHGYEIFNTDDSVSISKSSYKHSSVDYDESNETDDEVLRHHFVESSDDSYNGSTHNQDGSFSPENNNMETINEESCDSLSASHNALNKINSQKSIPKSKLNESTNKIDDEESQKSSYDNESLNSDYSESINESLSSDNSYEFSNESSIEDKENLNNEVLQHKILNNQPLFEDPNIALDNDDNECQMSYISSLEDMDKYIYNNNKEKSKTSESKYYDIINNDNTVYSDEDEGDTIEIIDNSNNEYDNESSSSSNKIFYSTNVLNTEDDYTVENKGDNIVDNENKYLSKEEIISKVSKKHKSKSRKYNSIGPKSNIKSLLEENESNIKNITAMSTTNLDGKNDPSGFLNKRLEGKESIDTTGKSLSNNFNKTINNNQENIFDSNTAFVNKSFDEDGNLKEKNNDNQLFNSNYSIFYDKVEGNSEISNKSDSDDEFFDSKENAININSNNEREFESLKDNDNDENENDNIAYEYKKIGKTHKQHNAEGSDSTTVDEDIHYNQTHEKNDNFSDINNNKKLNRKNSKRIPKCISKSSAAALSLIQLNMDNVDVDKVNDNDLDNLINKTHKHDDSNTSAYYQDKNQKHKLLELNTEFFSCEDDGTNFNTEQKLNVINNKKILSTEQSIPKSPAKPAPPPPSYNKIKTKSTSTTETSVQENKEENEIHTKTISDEIRERLDSKRKKDHRPEDINKMTYKEILKEKKALKQELVLLKSMYNHNHSNNSTSKYNNNDFIKNTLMNAVGSNLEVNNENSKLNGKPPLNYDPNSGVISKKLQKEDIKYMKELYQKYAEIKFMIAKQ
ncbi:hypothetical protein PIROE2DRAFT_2563, partial [Piromyces sp. E2]